MLISSSWIPDFILLLVTISIVSYFYATRKFNYWKKRNVSYQKPFPFVGNFMDVVSLKKTLGEWLHDAYKATKEPYFGIFVFDEPYLVIKKPDLIKNVIVKDFAYFTNRSVAYPEHNKILSNALFFMQNQEWKSYRSQLSPSFTSGKLKMMFPCVAEIGERFQKYLNDNQGELEAKEVAAKYSTDVIGKCFFGINSHCFDDENATFRVLGRKAFDFTLRNAFASTSYFALQKLVNLFKIDFIEKSLTDYFTDSFQKVFEAREKDSKRVNDFIDILKDMKRKGNEGGELRMERIKGAGLQFFLAGFETTSSTISYTLYELSLNKNIQNKLRQEILANIKQNKGLTYEGVLDMKYLDLCVKETLRKYPVLPFLDRRCLSDYKLPGTNLTIEKGTPVYIPLFGLHYDEEYFPESKKYIPERFDGKNYNNDGLVYMPFGEGPRICIGERFGLLSTKIGVISVLTKFEVERCEKTPDPVEFEPRSFVLQSKVGLPMTFKYLVPSPA